MAANKREKINRYLEEIMNKNRPSDDSMLSESNADLEDQLKNSSSKPGRSAQFYESDPAYSEIRGHHEMQYAGEHTDHSRNKFGSGYSRNEDVPGQYQSRDLVREGKGDINYTDKFRNLQNVRNPPEENKSYEGSHYESYYSNPHQEQESAQFELDRKANFKKNNFLEPEMYSHQDSGKKIEHQAHKNLNLHDDEDICMSFNHETSNRKPVNILANNYKYKDQDSLSLQYEFDRRNPDHKKTNLRPEQELKQRNLDGRQPHSGEHQPSKFQKYDDRQAKQARESVYQGLMDSLVQLKEHHSSGFAYSRQPFGKSERPGNNQVNHDEDCAMPLDQILTKFHTILLSPTTPLSQDELYSISYLFSFYQKHIADLQDKIHQLEASSKELHRREKVQNLDKSGLSEVSQTKDPRQELALARLQSMANSAEQTAQQAKRNEALAIERLSKVMTDKEAIEKELYMVRDKMDKLHFKYQAAEMEINKLNHENKLLNNKCHDILKEKKEAIELAEDVQRRIGHSEDRASEVDFLKAANEKLKVSAEGLIEEVCRYKFRVKELELENNALKDIKEIAMSSSRKLMNDDIKTPGKFDDFDQQFSDKMFRDLQSAGSNQRTIKSANLGSSTTSNPYSTNYHDLQHDYKPSRSDQIGKPPSGKQESFSPKQEKQAPQALPPRQPSNSSSQMAQIIGIPKAERDKEDYGQRRPQSGTGSREVRRSSSTSITTMPAQQYLADNAALINQLEQELSEFQHKKAELDGRLCRMKEKPKTLTERQEKEVCENELELVVKKMSEVRRRLRDFNK